MMSPQRGPVTAGMPAARRTVQGLLAALLDASPATPQLSLLLLLLLWLLDVHHVLVWRPVTGLLVLRR